MEVDSQPKCKKMGNKTLLFNAEIFIIKKKLVILWSVLQSLIRAVAELRGRNSQIATGEELIYIAK